MYFHLVSMFVKILVVQQARSVSRALHINNKCTFMHATHNFLLVCGFFFKKFLCKFALKKKLHLVVEATDE